MPVQRVRRVQTLTCPEFHLDALHAFHVFTRPTYSGTVCDLGRAARVGRVKTDHENKEHRYVY